MAEEMRLTKLERMMLINQLRILEALYPDEAPELSRQREAFERGYEILYAWDTDYVYDGDDVMTAEESREVWDTMDMFDAINRATSDEFVNPDSSFTKFAGYDGNNEGKFMGFAQFTVERLRRFEYLPMLKPGYWNSHMPMRDIYGRMLEAWKQIPAEQRSDMTAEQLQQVLAAAVHPENR
ncbi:YfbU family protein [Pelagibacterium sp.]|uniref:YfbU family protein n=1 Tax=Pelagibacterium sp. TaxID=1967288 RepID=UPI003A91935A